MRNHISQIRIFIASPGDVLVERNLAFQVIELLKYDAFLRDQVDFQIVGWDYPKGGIPMLANYSPQESVEAVLPRPSECDIVVVILWSRLGTPLPETYKKPDGSRYGSGTEFEFLDAMSGASKHGKPLIVVYRRSEVPVIQLDDPNKTEKIEQWEQVNKLIDDFRNPDRSIKYGLKPYQTPNEFKEQFERDLRELVKQLLQSPQGLLKTEKAKEVLRTSPFKGLQPYSANDAKLYFGRGRETDSLVEMVKRQPYVVVVGASGSGKSSLVGAGLIPRMQIEGDFGEIIMFSPDVTGVGNPFTSLFTGLNTAYASSMEQGFAKKLMEAPESLIFFLRKATSQTPEKKVLIIIDQFEELFTTIDNQYREPFIKLISCLSEINNVRAVFTLRSDFYSHFLANPILAELIRESTYSLGTPGVKAMFEIVTRPAEIAGIEVEDQLVQRILEDAGNEPGAVALVSYVLDELYRHCEKDGRMSITKYEELGGVRGAIGKKADEIYSSLDEDVRNVFSNVFRELLEVDEQGRIGKQKAPINRFTSDLERTFIAKFTESRLLIKSGNEAMAFIEIAHEAVVFSWSALSLWVDERKDDLRVLRQVKMAAEEWDRHERRDDYLWSHERLQPVYKMKDQLGISFEPLLEAFTRPELSRLRDEFQNEATKDYRKKSIVDRLSEFGEEAIPALVDCLLVASKDSYSFGDDHTDQIISVLSKYPAVSAAEIKKRTGDLNIETDENKIVRLVKAMRELKEVSFVPYLIELIQNSSKIKQEFPSFSLTDLSGEAVSTLLELVDPMDVKGIFLECYQQSGNNKLKEKIADALRICGDSNDANILADTLLKEEESVQQEVIKTLGFIGDLSIKNKFYEIIRQKPNNESFSIYNPKTAAILALGRMKDVDATPMLQKILTAKNQPDEVIVAAIKALGLIGDVSNIPIFGKFIKDPRSDIRDAVIEGIRLLHQPACIPLLTDAIDSKMYNIDDIISILIELDDPICCKSLVAALPSSEFRDDDIADFLMKYRDVVDVTADVARLGLTPKVVQKAIPIMLKINTQNSIDQFLNIIRNSKIESFISSSMENEEAREFRKYSKTFPKYYFRTIMTLGALQSSFISTDEGTQFTTLVKNSEFLNDLLDSLIYELGAETENNILNISILEAIADHMKNEIVSHIVLDGLSSRLQQSKSVNKQEIQYLLLSLGGIPKPDELAELSQDAKIQIASNAGMSNDPKYTNLLRKLARDEDLNVRIAAISNADNYPEVTNLIFDEYFRKDSSRYSPEEVCACINLMGTVKRPDLPIDKLLQSPNENIVLTVLNLMVTLELTDHNKRVIHLLGSDNKAITYAAARVLSRTGNDADIEKIMNILSETGATDDTAVVALPFDANGIFIPYEGIIFNILNRFKNTEVLYSLLGIKNKEITLAVIKAMGDLNIHQGFNVLRDYLYSEDNEVSTAAINAIIKVQDQNLLFAALEHILGPKGSAADAYESFMLESKVENILNSIDIQNDENVKLLSKIAEKANVDLKEKIYTKILASLDSNMIPDEVSGYALDLLKKRVDDKSLFMKEGFLEAIANINSIQTLRLLLKSVKDQFLLNKGAIRGLVKMSQYSDEFHKEIKLNFINKIRRTDLDNNYLIMDRPDELIMALGDFNDMSMIPLLKLILRGYSINIRKSAAQALKKIDLPEAKQLASTLPEWLFVTKEGL